MRSFQDDLSQGSYGATQDLRVGGAFVYFTGNLHERLEVFLVHGGRVVAAQKTDQGGQVRLLISESLEESWEVVEEAFSKLLFLVGLSQAPLLTIRVSLQKDCAGYEEFDENSRVRGRESLAGAVHEQHGGHGRPVSKESRLGKLGARLDQHGHGI